MKLVAAAIAFLILAPAMAQEPKTGSQGELQRAKQKCEANHGVDCNSSEGLKEWVLQDRPMTAEQQRSAAAARLRREQCAKTKNGAGC